MQDREYTDTSITLTTRAITPLSALNSIAAVLPNGQSVTHQEQATQPEDANRALFVPAAMQHLDTKLFPR